MAIANVQRKGKGANASSISIGAGDGWATPTSGNLLVVSANSDATVSITGTWTAGPSVVDGNGTYFWYRTSDGTESTITCTPSVSDTIDITACEYSGTDASLFDASNSSTIASSGGTTTTSVSVTTTAAGDLIVAAALLHSYGNPAPTSPSWTNSFTNQLTATTGGTTSADVTTFFAELIAGAAGSYSTSASWTNIASDRQELVMAFKAAATAAATYPPQRPRSREPVPLRIARTRETTPVRAQVNPPYPTAEIDQPRRVRGWLFRRGEIRVVVPPQFNPPFPYAEIDQPRRVRGIPTRRCRTVAPVPAQVVVAPVAFPFQEIDQPHRIRGLLPHRGRLAVPPLPDISPPAGPRRDRPVVPALRRRVRAAQILPAEQLVAAPRRDRPNPPATRRGKTIQPLGVQLPPVPPAWVPVVTRIRQWRPFHRAGQALNFLFPGADHQCVVPRPNTGVTARPSTGTTVRPDTGTVPFEC